MSNIIVTTRDELSSIIQEVYRKLIDENKEIVCVNTTYDILSLSEACAFLKLAKQTIYGFTSKNKIPFFKKGKKLYFKKSELESWITEGKQLTEDEIKKGGFEALKSKKRKQKNGTQR